MADTFTPSPAPEVSTSSERSYRAQIAQFGDGYEQRIADGINTRRLTASLVWNVLSHTAAATLEAFADAHPSWVRINYTLPWEASARKWRIESVSRREVQQRISALTITLVEVHDL